MSVTILEDGNFQPVAGIEKMEMLSSLAEMKQMVLPSVFRGEIEMLTYGTGVHCTCTYIILLSILCLHLHGESYNKGVWHVYSNN